MFKGEGREILKETTPPGTTTTTSRGDLDRGSSSSSSSSFFSAPSTATFHKSRRSYPSADASKPSSSITSSSAMTVAGIHYMDQDEGPPPRPPRPRKRRRTSEDFLLFCQMVLDYENFDAAAAAAQEDARRRHSSSPLGSTGSTESSNESIQSKEDLEAHSGDNKSSDLDTEDDNWEQITCYCKKPFAGRPMIECSSCLTWVHLKCAKLRRTNIPDTWLCSHCQGKGDKAGVKKTSSTKSLRNKPSKSRRSSSQKRKRQMPVKNAGDKIVSATSVE